VPDASPRLARDARIPSIDRQIHSKKVFEKKHFLRMSVVLAEGMNSDLDGVFVSPRLPRQAKGVTQGGVIGKIFRPNPDPTRIGFLTLIFSLLKLDRVGVLVMDDMTPDGHEWQTPERMQL
jgi:hypothetical protein